MKYDTNENPVEIAGSKTDYNFEKNNLEVAGNTNETKVNKQEDHDRMIFFCQSKVCFFNFLICSIIIYL